ncbi:MAG: fluoride efflux transporter FluC [Brachybacterium sp.]|uniref:fluoride efflux transporter FluC n=1 Tax=Brachybacterium sp. TaxID=1891286 RepID=UPI002652E8D3|nr:CrcB family protein [Brachybacterium sp.]MDN6302885.1 CrcB family protein [Brachybacterium sp.]MDN6328034.1 CrcB family protein [Brachybacterium sp.]
MSAGGLLVAALLVGVGGGLGSVVRWGIRVLGLRLIAAGGWDRWSEETRPGTTVLANILACFLLGIVVARLGSAGGNVELVYLMLAVGFCGGLSTLSTAASDIVELVRRPTFSLALAYLLLSAGTGMAALWLGLVLAS